MSFPTSLYFVSSTKNTDGFNLVNTFLKVDSLDRSPAAFTPSNLNDFVKLFILFLFPLLPVFFLVDITLIDFVTDFALSLYSSVAPL